MADALAGFNMRNTPQRSQASPRQVKNNADGFVFEINDLTRLRRFLTLGTDGGTFYVNAAELTQDNAEVVVRMAQEQPTALVDAIVEISTQGRAPKQNPALFALAIAASLSDEKGRQYALSKLPEIARTATHLFLFARYVEQFRGWGRSLRRTVASWYTEKAVEQAAYQMVKYRQRGGWSHRDLLRLAHPVTAETDRKALFEWAARGTITAQTPDLVTAFVRTQDASLEEATQLIEDFPLSWEMFPDRLLSEPALWKALIHKGMPQTALIRQLPRLTRLGVLEGSIRSSVCEQLADLERLRQARVHPINMLIAQRTYASGQAGRGRQTWTPSRHVVDALDRAFYASFGTVEPTGKRTLLALDVSGSMSFYPIANMPITPREASAALALVTASVEENCDIVGFTGANNNNNARSGRKARRAFHGLTPLTISPRQRLDDVIRSVSDLPFGPTDCALPMVYAMENGLQYDTFVIYTDNETWFGDVHPYQALRQYRETTGIHARLIVVGMTATKFSIADPDDAGMLDVSGFDSAMPGLISDFSRGLV